METINFKNLHQKISRKLLNSRYLRINNISKSLIAEHLSTPTYIDNLNIMIKEKDFSCKRIFFMCQWLMNEIYENIKELRNLDESHDLLVNELNEDNTGKKWITYLYNYALSKSFPEAVSIELRTSLDAACEVYLKVLKIISDFQKNSEDGTWQSKYPMQFLTEGEISGLESDEEYTKFLKSFKKEYIYEMMKLNGEVFGYNTLDHICGVHHLSLYIGRQLNLKNLPIDLGRVSGAAAGHDIGKYGCKGEELKRVPHLHYYYTDQWFKKHSINYIRNVAINHSTWDLELENLSLENLVLIYSDFRVKNIETSEGFKMHIFSLADSFQVILDKLENVDEKKEKRYKRVYAKLKDFEKYLKSLGVNTTLEENQNLTLIEKPIYSLMQGKDIVQNLKYISINHNIKLMYALRDEYSIEEIFEQAKSESHWKNLRQYIRVFEEYSTYLTQKQKLQTINFLYEYLTHPEDDIRRHCAELIGVLIAIFDEDYNKEIPKNVVLENPMISSVELFKEYLELLLYPSHKIFSGHRTWIGYSTRIMVNSLFINGRKALLPAYRNVLMEYYGASNLGNNETQLFLLETAKYIPMEPYDAKLSVLFTYILSMAKKRSTTLRIAALEVISEVIKKVPEESEFREVISEYFKENHGRGRIPIENLLKLKIVTNLNLKDQILNFEKACELDNVKMSEVFLSNLKSATDWIKKKNQIELLLNYTLKNIEITGLHTAIHFCNLLKVSAVETVRKRAGFAILKIMPNLTLPERNEVAVELLRALEIDEHRFTEYIPPLLGEVILWLEPKEFNEIIEDFKFKIKASAENIKPLILKTIGVCISNYGEYQGRFSEKKEGNYKRLVKMVGILLNGLADYKTKVKQSAISTLGKDIFGSKNLSLEEKNNIFKLIAKKVLTLITDDERDRIIFLTNSAALNHMYRFISDYNFFKGDINIPIPKKTAFFPGTFDPFTLSHKIIAKAIRDMDFEVYLAVDEFSWSKKTLPNLLRKVLINMSVADELNIFIYPEVFQTNISNEEDLKRLKDNFNHSQVYFVAGSDVVLNASCYKKPSLENSIHSFPHIIFERGKSKQLEEAKKKIQGEVSILNLPSTYASISSSQIRDYIDRNRDISTLIDPLVQQYIYENGFYQREPLEKMSLTSSNVDIEFAEEITESLIKNVSNSCKDRELVFNLLTEHSKTTAPKLVIIKNKESGEILGFSSLHWVRSHNLYREFHCEKVSRYIRESGAGRLILIDAMYINNKEKSKFLEQVLITETLAYAVGRDYEFAIFKPKAEGLYTQSLVKMLNLHGFREIEGCEEGAQTLVVDMSNPCVLNLDMENVLKEPFRSNNKVKAVIASTRKKLQESLGRLYPGELIISFESDVLHQKMIKKICKENEVSTKISHNKEYGEAMCVPYGDILDRYVVPNTVTKSLHTEKYYNPDMKSFFIGEPPYYLSLENQVKMIKSFSRPVILVDNILHKGYRIKALDPLLKKEGVEVKKIISGILSGRGKDLMDMQNREVDTVYFIPKLKIWFNENSLYPFIGGDALWRGTYARRNLIPSVNSILPYTYPVFVKNASYKNIYDLSKVAIENAIDLLKTLENEYHLLYSRNLTLSTLGEVITTPRRPDIGRDMHYDLGMAPSHYLQNDLEQLSRLENMFQH
jgi:nicotinic acid mononucleotide adenylyltransferase